MKIPLTREKGRTRCLYLFSFILALSLMASNAPVGGQERKVLTLEEALRIADEKNKDIQKTKEYRKQLEGRYVEERAAALPQFDLSGTLLRTRDESQATLSRGLFGAESENRIADVGVTQPIYTFGRIGSAMRAAKIGLATADDQLRLYRQAARRDVSASFYDILLAREIYALARQNREQKKRHLDEARRKYAAGVATEYDVLAAEVGLENALPEVIRRENLIRTMKDKLLFLLGVEGGDFEVEGSLQVSPSPYPSYHEAVRLAAENRPELGDLRKRVEVGKELVKIYDAGNMPRLDFKARYGWKDIEQGALRGEGQYWLAGVFLSFPLFDGMKTQGKVAQAKSDVASLKIDEAKLLDTISLQVREAGNSCREAAEIVQALSGTVRQAEKLLAMAEKGFQYGVKTKLEVDDAQFNLLQAQANLAQARRNYIVSRMNLDWVMGILGERS